MSPFAVDKRDIMFCLHEYLNVERLCKFPRFSELNREMFDMVMDEAIKIAVNILDPLNIVLDREGLKFENGNVITPKQCREAYNAFKDGGWIAPACSVELGGQGLPMVIESAIVEVQGAASISFVLTPGLGRAAGRLLESYGSEEMKKIIPRMFSGEWGGTMCLTEASAGSAVGDLKTKAKRQGDHFLIEGEKIFITAGQHDMTSNIIHMVLARIEGAPKGIKGVSLFMVPRDTINPDDTLGANNNVICGNIEHKMGIHGSPTCTLVFGADGPCHGWLIGEENKGIQYMFHMMNEARIGVGLQGLSTAMASYMQAVQYAKERVQGVDIAEMRNVDAPRVPIIKHPDVKRNLLIMKSYTEGMRALLYYTAMCTDVAAHSPDEEERSKAEASVELLTPICKAYCSEYGFRMTAVGVQIYGGYGYTQEYQQEQYLRDALISTIYEGTNGIQALDLLGRKISGKGGLLLISYLMQMNEFITEHKEHGLLGPYVLKLEKVRDALSHVVMHFQKVGMDGDIYYPVLNATSFMDMFGTITLSYLLLQQAAIAEKRLSDIYHAASATTDKQKAAVIQNNPEAKFYDGKLHSMRFFIDNNLPHAHATADTILSGNRSPLDVEF